MSWPLRLAGHVIGFGTSHGPKDPVQDPFDPFSLSLSPLHHQKKLDSRPPYRCFPTELGLKLFFATGLRSESASWQLIHLSCAQAQTARVGCESVRIDAEPRSYSRQGEADAWNIE